MLLIGGQKMSEKSRRERGLEMIQEVYAGDVVTPGEGHTFSDIMLEQLFAEIWPRDILSMRDKRILLLGIIAEKGEASTFKIQAKASLKRGEMTPKEVRELLLFIAQYAGYPRAASIIGPLEEAIAEVAAERKK
jgi:4-carboxymuconolactone decarboxylase